MAAILDFNQRHKLTSDSDSLTPKTYILIYCMPLLAIGLSSQFWTHIPITPNLYSLPRPLGGSENLANQVFENLMPIPNTMQTG